MLTQALQDHGYTRHAPTGVWISRAAGVAPFAYSDGDVEGQIYEQLGRVQDRTCGSMELASLITDWPRQYHFAPQRGDLLRPLSHLLGGDVLEVGSGCGAISRYLGETSRSVVGLEGAMRRAAIARRRCEDLSNVEIVCQHAMDFAPMRRFDAVVLVGVLEYSRCFIEAADPVQAMLLHCRKFLKPGGVLIVAIENQLGLKYFSGAPEDHVNQPFFGINDGYTDKTVVTFGRQELTGQLNQAGFVGTRFFYPFPDYKIPTTVLTHEGASDGSEVMQNVAASFNARTMNLPYPRAFSEERAWPLLLRNGVLPDLANSFLVVARETLIHAGDDVVANLGDLAYVYSTSRQRQFAKETRLCRSGADVQVVRRRLYAQLSNTYDILNQVIENETALTGRSLSRDLSQVINRPGWGIDDLAQWARPWVQHLRQYAVAELDGPHAAFEVPGHLIDCSPGNLMVEPDGSLKDFDLEWRVDDSIPALWPLFRGMFYSLYNHASIARPGPQVPEHLVDVVRATLRTLDVSATADEVDHLLQLEAAFFHASPEGFKAARWTARAH